MMILSGSSSVSPSHCSAVHVYRNYRAAVQGHIEEKKTKHAHTKKGAVMWRGVSTVTAFQSITDRGGVTKREGGGWEGERRGVY